MLDGQQQAETPQNTAEAVAQHSQSQEQGSYSEPTDEELLALLDDEETPEGGGNEPPPAEPKTEPEEEGPQEDPLSKKFAELASMESKYQKQIRELKEKIDSFESGTKDKMSRDELLEELRSEYKKNPKAFLEKKLGGSYDELSDYILNEEDRSREYEQKSLIEELKNEINELKGNFQQKEQTEKEREYNKKIETFKSNIQNYVAEKGEDFGLINELGESDTVFEVMQNYYKEHGKTLDIEEACQQVEGFHMDRLKALSKLEKVKNLFNVDNKTESTNRVERQQGEPQLGESKSETLESGFISGYSESDLDNMSDEERERIALGLL